MGYTEYKFGNIINTTPSKVDNIDFDTEQTLKDIIDNMSETIRELSLVRSHIGMIVQSTTLDTMEKVIEIYGGTTWTKIEGRMLLGQSENYDVNSTGGNEDAVIPYHKHDVNSSTTGTESVGHTHTGTTSTNGDHSHATYIRKCSAEAAGFGLKRSPDGFNDRVLVDTYPYAAAVGTTGAGSHNHTMTTGTESANHTHTFPEHSTQYVGESIEGANMPPYKAVYIWERVA